MRAVISNNCWIYFDNITTDEEEVLWRELSASKPNAYIDSSQMGLWDGVFRQYNKAKKRIARPLLSMLRGVCAKHDLPLEIVDDRPAWEYSPVDKDTIDKDFLYGITLDDHQVEAIRKSCSVECGIIDVPTGGGKGEIICGICKAHDCPTIIIADQKIVIDQIKARLELRQINEDIGLFYAGKRPSGQSIVVGSAQSLLFPKPPQKPQIRQGESLEKFNIRANRYTNAVAGYKTRKKNSKVLQQYVKDAEMIIVDECDKCTSQVYKDMFRYLFKGRKRFGLSGTPMDKSKPVEALIMQSHLGSVVAKETRKNLVAKGRIISCDYIMIAIGPFDGISRKEAYDIAVDDYMVNSDSFHTLVTKLAKKYQGDGTLVLVDRQQLGLNLVKVMTFFGLKAKFICGKTPQKLRNETLRMFERREIDVLVGGKIINRGLDLSGGCENLIIATGGKLQSEFEQKIGRALRHNKRGKSRIIDFYFRCNKYLYDHSRERLKIMVDLEYDTKIVFPNGIMTGEQLVNGRFAVQKKYLIKPTKALFKN